ncbi:hypothetical protein Bca52824_058431 [Brassica carinata]|uniref:Uncharacterized protein n=1 Tax=Brassica carinata TaxID=52824 RepID=A0A8X7QTG8_BRACI|nr:hypothetical protein Bca52824_058431 [Brassica carinata]
MVAFDTCTLITMETCMTVRVIYECSRSRIDAQWAEIPEPDATAIDAFYRHANDRSYFMPPPRSDRSGAHRQVITEICFELGHYLVTEFAFGSPRMIELAELAAMATEVAGVLIRHVATSLLEFWSPRNDRTACAWSLRRPKLACAWVTILLTIVAASNISSAPAGVSDSIPVSANDEVLSSAYIKEKTLKKLSKQQLMGPYAMKKVQIQNKEQLELVRVEIRVSSLFNQPSCSLLEGMSKLEGIGSTERERLWPELVQSFKDIIQRLKLNKVEEAEEAWWWWSRHRLHIRRSMARDEKTKGW